MPGPSHYEMINKASLSSLKTSNAANQFSRAERKTDFAKLMIKESKSPGPGDYGGENRMFDNKPIVDYSTRLSHIKSLVRVGS